MENHFTMELTYVYTAPRTEFGRQCCFSDSAGVLFDIKPDKSLQSKYMDRNPVNRDTVTLKIQAEHSVSSIIQLWTPISLLYHSFPLYDQVSIGRTHESYANHNAKSL